MGASVGGRIGVALLGILAWEALMAQEPAIAAGLIRATCLIHPSRPQSSLGSNLIRTPCHLQLSDGGGYAVVGPDNCIQPGTTQWLAGAFIAAATGVPKQISVPIILRDPANCPTNAVTLSIYTDACYPTGPGTPLVSAVATVPAEPAASQ